MQGFKFCVGVKDAPGHVLEQPFLSLWWGHFVFDFLL